MRKLQECYFGKALSILLCWTILLTGVPLQSISAVKADYPSQPPSTITTDFEYDGNGNLISRTDGNGKETTFAYDVMNRLISIDYPGGSSPDVSFTYDKNGNRTSMTDRTGTTAYTYDIFDHVIQIDYPGGNFIHYGYDRVGNVTDLQYGNWQMVAGSGSYTYVQYAYDADNRISEVNNVFTEETTSYQYDKAGNITRRDLPNGAYAIYGYDTDGRLTSVEHRNNSNGLIVKYEYSLNAIGNRTEVVETDSGGSKTTTYTYDALDRLATVDYDGARFVEYAYDNFGNRTSMSETIGEVTTVTDYYYDSDSRLLYTKINGVEDEHFFYDAIGNLIQRIGVSPGNATQVEYIYDNENRLIRYYDGTNNVEYVYNGVGERVAKIVNGQRTNFLNDPAMPFIQALMELDDSGMPTKVRVWGNELINCENYDGSNPYYYLHDSINGSVRRMIDSSASVVNTYEYDAFGKPTTKIEGASIDNDYQFQGEVQEEKTGLVFLRARHYDPEIGRFLTRDPYSGNIGYPESLNPYIFVRQNPVNLRDPSGRVAPVIVGAICALGGVIIYGLLTPWEEQDLKGYAVAAGAGFVVPFAAIALGLSGAGLATLGAGVGVLEAAATTKANTTEGLATDIFAGAFAGLLGGSKVDLLEGVNYRNTRYFSGLLTPSNTENVIKDFCNQALINVLGYGIQSPLAQPGGVALNKTAEVLLDINKIKGGTYDPATGQLIIYGEQDVSLPAMSIDDLAVAAKAASMGAMPVVSIDPPAVTCASNGCNSSQCFSVRYGDPVWDDTIGGYVVQDLSSGTHFGWVMFEADRTMKCLALNKDNITCQSPFLADGVIPGYKNMVQRYRENFSEGSSTDRFWFQPKEIKLVPSLDGKSMVFSEDTAVELLTESKYLSGGMVSGDPVAEEFAAHFNAHFDEFAAQFPVFEQLRQLAKVVGVMRWIKENNIPIDLSLIEQHKPGYTATPWTTPKTSVTETWDEPVPGGHITYTVTVEGGVTYCHDLQLEPASAGPESAILAARPNETALSWTANVSGTNYNVAAVSLDSKPKDGGMNRSDADASVQVNGVFPLMLSRYFNSFDVVPGMFGWGWEVTPYQLKFKGSRSQFNICSQQWEGYNEVWFVDRPGQGVYKYTPAGIYDVNSDPLGIASRFDPQQSILVYRYETEEVPGILLSDNKTNMTMRLASGILLDFDMSGNLKCTEDRNANQIIYSYDNDNRLVDVNEPVCGKTISFNYDSKNMVTNAAISGGRTVTYAYDANDNLISAQVDAPNGRKIQYAYDDYHNLIEVRNAEGLATATSALDVYGRVTSVTQPGVAAPFLQNYSLASRTTSTTGPEGFSQSMEFDTNYNVTSLTDSRGNDTNRSYNSYQDVISQTNAEGQTTEFYYNQRGDRIAATLPNGRSDMVLVNINGDPNLSCYVSPSANFANNFDSEHYLTAETISGVYYAYRTEYAYDSAGNLITVLDARGNERNYAYDSRGNRIWSKDGCNYRTDYTYDDYSRLTHIENEQGHAVDYTYDNNDNLTQISIAAGTVDMTYDGKDLMETVTTGDSGNRHTTTYGYNSNNQLAGVTDANGTITSYDYDQRHNLTRITHNGVVRFEYEYDQLNRLSQIRYLGTAADAACAAVPVFPAGNERLQDDILIQWCTLGDWSGNENLDIYYTTNGSSWTLIDTVNYDDASYLWHTSQIGPPYLSSGTVQIKFVRPGDTEFRAAKTSLFQISNGGRFYVNDAATTNDMYCNTTGQPYNGSTVTGLTPDDPVNDVRDIVGNYGLEPGDTIYVDTGEYSISSDIVFSSSNSGTAEEPVTIIGSTTGTGTTITRTSPSSGCACILTDGAQYINIEHLKLTGAQYGIRLDNSANCTVRNNECYNNGLYDTALSEGRGTGVYLLLGGGHLIESNICRQNGANGINGSGPGVNGKPGRGWGILVESSVDNAIKKNECFNNAGSGGASGGSGAVPGFSESIGIFIATPTGSPSASNNLILENICHDNTAHGTGFSTGVPGVAKSTGIAAVSTVNSTIEGNLVYNNNAFGGDSPVANGGWVYTRGIYGQGETSLAISRNQVSNHLGRSGQTGSGNFGGWNLALCTGIELNNCANSVAKNNLSINNQALAQTWLGSGQYSAVVDAGILFQSSNQCSVYNNTIIRNYGYFKDNSGQISGKLFAHGDNIMGNLFRLFAGQVYIGLDFFVAPSSTSDVYNNIFWSGESRAGCVSVDSGCRTGFVSNYNLFYITNSGLAGNWAGTSRTTLPNWRTSSGQDANSLSTNPNFYAPDVNNFHLASNSPAIDIGKTLPSVLSDIDGEARPADGPDADLLATYDIGYDEYVDTDNDELTDWVEENITHTNKDLWDTDGDGMHDGWEVRFSLNPNSNVGDDGAAGDPDHDGYTNIEEYPGYDPRNPSIHPTTPPVLTQVLPGGSNVFIVEGGSVSFSVTAEDRDGDPISYSWRLDGVQQSTQPSWTLTTNDESSGTHQVLIEVTAGGDSVTHEWTVDVSNVNRAPQIDPNSLPNQTKEIGETVTLNPTYSDPDNENGVTNDDNTHTVSFSGWKDSNSFLLQPGDGGVHTITVTVTDNGSPPMSDSHVVTITVPEEPPREGDLNGDGKVDYCDLEKMAEQWLGPPGTPSADIAPSPTGDGIVNFLDFAVLAQHWLEGVTP